MVHRNNALGFRRYGLFGFAGFSAKSVFVTDATALLAVSSVRKHLLRPPRAAWQGSPCQAGKAQVIRLGGYLFLVDEWAKAEI